MKRFQAIVNPLLDAPLCRPHLPPHVHPHAQEISPRLLRPCKARASGSTRSKVHLMIDLRHHLPDYALLRALHFAPHQFRVELFRPIHTLRSVAGPCAQRRQFVCFDCSHPGWRVRTVGKQLF